MNRESNTARTGEDKGGIETVRRVNGQKGSVSERIRKMLKKERKRNM